MPVVAMMGQYWPGGRLGWALGSALTTGTLSGPVNPLTTSPKSPGLTIVPTPEIWSTCTAMPTSPDGTSMLLMLPFWLRTVVEMYWPAVTFVRAIWPTTNDVSVKASVGFCSTGTSFVVTSAAWIVAPRAMSLPATTILVVVGG